MPSTLGRGSPRLAGSMASLPLPHEQPLQHMKSPTAATSSPDCRLAPPPALQDLEGALQRALDWRAFPLCSLPLAGQPHSALSGCSPSDFAADGERGVRDADPAAQTRPCQQALSPTQHPQDIPQHRSPAAQRSSPACPCPAPSVHELYLPGPSSRPCRAGRAAVSSAQLCASPQPADGPGWGKELGESEGPPLNTQAGTEETLQPVALGTGWPWPCGVMVSHRFFCQLLQLCSQIQEASLCHILIQLEKAEAEP